MLIESLEKKTRLAMVTVMLALGASTVICAACFYFCTSLVREQQNQVYVLDGTIPFMAERSKNEMTFNIEAKAHIQLFHQYFFDLSPDDEYLKWTFSKAMYLADESALRQKQARSITTVGRLQNVPRTQNNPHGLMITNWRTLENKDLKSY